MKGLFYLLALGATTLASAEAADARTRGATKAEIRAHTALVSGCFDSIETVSPYTTRAPDVDGIPGGQHAGLEEMMSARSHSPYRPEPPLSEAAFRAYAEGEMRYAGAPKGAVRYEQYGTPAYAVTIAVLPDGRQHAQVVRNGRPCGVVEVSRR